MPEEFVIGLALASVILIIILFFVVPNTSIQLKRIDQCIERCENNEGLKAVSYRNCYCLNGAKF